MKPQLLIFVAVGVLIAANTQEEKAAKRELKKLEGTWVMVSGENNGQKLSEEVVKNAKLTMVRDKHTVKLGEDTIIGTHKLNPSSDPKEIDAMDTEGPFKGQTTLGIY